MTTKLFKQKRNTRLKAYRRTLNGRLSRAAERANKLAADHNLKGRVTTAELKAMYEEQGGLCLITGRSLTPDRPSADSHMSLDHLVAAQCASGVANGTSSNMCLVRLPINKAKGSRPLCELFNETKPILTEYMVQVLSEERQKDIIDIQYQQLKALGRDVDDSDYIVMKNYRRKRSNRRKNIK
ncbi:MULTISPECIES: hypothetical protein [Exiguobacterium]|uniref:hypothetical protein n=1 Tax=Exiguobacterium TaxID=33986 RepID=UPI001BE5FF9C|nr:MULTISPECIES: hypothetical protein [Exiguobacterium]MCT4792849.1 hypothetical protein [Exiguobacterium artemiae]